MGARSLLRCLPALSVLLLAGRGDEVGTGVREAPPSREQTNPDAGTTAPVPESAPVVAFLGDSLAAGMQLPADAAFPAVLQHSLLDAGHPFRLVNAGVSGDTTAGGLARLDWILAQGPDVLVVELGANDGFRGLSVEATGRNLRAILAKARSRGVTPLLLGMRLPPNYGADYTGAFDALYPQIAEELDVAFVPFFVNGVAGVPAMNLSDGIHPTVEGHRRLAANLEEPLTRLLRTYSDR